MDTQMYLQAACQVALEWVCSSAAARVSRSASLGPEWDRLSRKVTPAHSDAAAAAQQHACSSAAAAQRAHPGRLNVRSVAPATTAPHTMSRSAASERVLGRFPNSQNSPLTTSSVVERRITLRRGGAACRTSQAGPWRRGWERQLRGAAGSGCRGSSAAAAHARASSGTAHSGRAQHYQHGHSTLAAPVHGYVEVAQRRHPADDVKPPEERQRCHLAGRRKWQACRSSWAARRRGWGGWVWQLHACHAARLDMTAAA